MTRKPGTKADPLRVMRRLRRDGNRHGRAVAVLLGVGVLVNYFDRVNLTVAHDALEKAFNISDANVWVSAERV